MNLFFAAFLVFLINIPFGFWRSKVKKFSWQWFTAIHLPVIFVIIIRIYTGLGFEFITYPVIILSFFLGQYLGGKSSQYNSLKK